MNYLASLGQTAALVAGRLDEQDSAGNLTTVATVGPSAAGGYGGGGGVSGSGSGAGSGGAGGSNSAGGAA